VFITDIYGVQWRAVLHPGPHDLGRDYPADCFRTFTGAEADVIWIDGGGGRAVELWARDLVVVPPLRTRAGRAGDNAASPPTRREPCYTSN
jgi:hypothetical protein